MKQYASPARTALILTAALAAGLLSACGQGSDEAAQLGSQPPAAGATAAPRAAESPADAAITADIQAKFAADNTLSPLAIRVRTKDGLVELDGKAPDETVRNHATRLAATAKNVLSVDNHMAIPRS
ncbi:BON domain-containing protein [Roseateles sp. DAIF2]|uniref:BON domain-containing protein n=1 Tax=Roseateles sp. DAIF2 TaxID=2714952 RepID=UPI0018A2885C|nr:BON domain-containing protein [Roseateles sp. DAIF2]QPF72269.1 BON domain-containing protein [Roseateles sp. DAIF2]